MKTNHPVDGSVERLCGPEWQNAHGLLTAQAASGPQTGRGEPAEPVPALDNGPMRRTGRKTDDGCILVLGKRQPAFVLRPSQPPFFSPAPDPSESFGNRVCCQRGRRHSPAFRKAQREIQAPEPRFSLCPLRAIFAKIQRNKPVPNKNKAVDPHSDPPPFRKFSAVSDLSESPLRATTHLRSACRPARQHPFCARPHAMTSSISPVPLSVSCERTEKPSR